MKTQKKLPLFKGHGFSIAECAFSLGIISIISAAVGALLSSSLNAQEFQNNAVNAQLASNTFTESLRQDTRSAVGVNLGGQSSDTTASSSGNTLTLYYFKTRDANTGQEVLVSGANAPFIRYTVTGTGRLLRTANVDPNTRQLVSEFTTVFVEPFDAARPVTRTSPTRNLRAVCTGNCFSYSTRSSSTDERSLVMTVNNISIQGLDPSVAQSLTPFDAFGQPRVNVISANYNIGSNTFR